MTEPRRPWSHPRQLGACLLLAMGSASAWANPPTGATPLATLDVPAYMGRWYQVALYPNRFQAQCLDSTSATYTLLDDGRVRVLNRCRTEKGWDDADGVARPREGAVLRADGTLAPASLEVNFLPAYLRWLGVGWGKYDVLQLGLQQAWAVVSEPTREYLWVLARTAQLDATQWAVIEALLLQRGFDLSRLKRETQPGETGVSKPLQ